MPTYEYRCEQCGHEMEAFQSITAKALRKCPACSKNGLKRLISGGGAILFKGSGFYETDYRSSDYKQKADADKKAAEPKTESKSDAKSETKAGPKGGNNAGSKADPKPAKKTEAKPSKKP